MLNTLENLIKLARERKSSPVDGSYTNKLLIDKGRELGLDIKEHHHNSSVTDFLSSYDLVINSNLEAISKISPPKIPLIIKSPNSVRLEHDSCSYLDNDTRKLLFSKAKKNFFLSNYHYNYFKHLFRNCKDINII